MVKWHSQPYSEEYTWLGPDLAQNTRGLYILIVQAVLITLIYIAHTFGPKVVSYYAPSVCKLL